MTSIIKNQIVKHLSKFAKNLTPDQISLDVLKGKSELKNIVLNEEVLTEVLELPVWLRIKEAKCNRVMVKIQWTKLKSAPVELFIDEIQVVIVLTADKPPAKKKTILPAYGMDTGSYGFANKVVEGMSIYVNTLEMHFDSGAFGGSLMLSRLSVESRTPGWQAPSDLRQSRLTCTTSNRTILHKQVSWQLLRIEASAKAEGTQRNTINAPLRLITSNGRIRIALKKNYTDGAVLHARITMILEDILWVATLPQLQSAIAFYSHIMKLVRAAEGFAPHETPVLPARTPQNLAPTEISAAAAALMKNTFRTFDFDQTSYHLHVKKIDLHLCDDAHSNNVYPPGWDIDSGAMQVTLNLMLIDIYPKTVATSDRSTWVRYESPNHFMTFLEQNLKSHFDKLTETLDETGKVRLKRCWPHLISFNVVFRVFDMSIQCVSDVSTKKDQLFNFFSSDREAKKAFPANQFILHAEFANFAHPMTDTLPVPPPMTHAQLGPFNLMFDKRTIRWCLYVVHTLTLAFNESEAPAMEPVPQTDIRLDLLMPKIIIKFPDASSDIRLPHRLLVSLSTLTLSNRLLDDDPSFRRLDTYVLDFLHGQEIPAGKDVLRSDLIQMNSSATVSGVQEGEQFWLHSSPVWAETDFGERTKPITLITDIPFRGSVTFRKEQLNLYLEPQSALTALVDHFQLLQLLRLSNDLSIFADLLSTDQKFLDNGKPIQAPTFLLMLPIAQVNLHLLLTHGPLPSPYEACPAINENQMDQNSFSDSDSVAARGETPLPRAAPAAATPQPRQTNTVAMEEFPEFPNAISGMAIEIDIASQMDETMSITTDISDDDANFAPLDVGADDPIYSQTAELAEEAVAVDERVENDRIFKSVMAKNVNVLCVALKDITALVSVHNQNLLVNGRAQTLEVSQQLNKLRSDMYTGLQSTAALPAVQHSKEPPQVVFKLDGPADLPYVTLTAIARHLNLDLHDEVIAHLSPFVADEIVTENKLRLQITVQDSTVQIVDPNKKKPLRLRLKECVIEQDED